MGQRIPVTRFMSIPPDEETTGEIESMSLLAGQSAGLVNEIKPAAAVVRELVDEAHQINCRQLPSTTQEVIRP